MQASKLSVATSLLLVATQCFFSCARPQSSDVVGGMDANEIQDWMKRARKLHSRVTEYLELLRRDKEDPLDRSEADIERIFGAGRGLRIRSGHEGFERLLATFRRHPDSAYVCYLLSFWAASLVFTQVDQLREARRNQGSPMTEEEYRQLVLDAARVSLEISGHTENVLLALDRQGGKGIRPDGGVE